MNRYHPLYKIFLCVLIIALFLFSANVLFEIRDLSHGPVNQEQIVRNKDVHLLQDELLPQIGKLPQNSLDKLNQEVAEKLGKQAPLLMYDLYQQNPPSEQNLNNYGSTFDQFVYLGNRQVVLSENGRVFNLSFFIKPATEKEAEGLSDPYYYKIYRSYKTQKDSLESKKIYAGISFLTAIALGLYLLTIMGRKKEGPYPIRLIDKIPLEIVLGGLGSLSFFGLVFGINALSIGNTSRTLDLFYIGSFLLVCFPLVELIMRRVYQETLLETSLLYRLARKFLVILKNLFSNLPLLWKGLVASGLYIVFSAFFLSTGYYNRFNMLFYYLLQAGFLYYVTKVIIGRRDLRKVTADLATGNLSSKVDIDSLSTGLKEEGMLINQISDGIGIAVSEQMKSESFRTELITNVSHDLKTPLTAIISYTDLLKKEGLDGPSSKEYLDALERQSARLKKLMEDILQVSKASTGTLEVHLEQSNVKELLLQVAGEYEEKLKQDNLDLVLSLPEEDLFIEADSTLIWRVLDNLLSNARKYSQPGTRVYISAEQRRQTVRIHVKNISKEKLNISAEELKQRFVRADSSRSSEGSGLGLAIAESLTQLQGGHLFIDIDGDLFKASLVFAQI